MSRALARQSSADDRHGLLSSKAADKLMVHGENDLGGDSGPSTLRVLISNIINPMNAVLAAALVASLVAADYVEAIILSLIIVTNSALSFRHEYKSERTMEALRLTSSPTARVVRDGVVAIVQAKVLVPGDIVLLQEGDQVPADVRLLEAVNLTINEALLTGEPEPVRKTVLELNTLQLPLADQKNLAFKSTLVTYGHGRGVVVKTGLHTEIGAIATQLSGGNSKQTGQHSQTPLKRAMQRMMVAMLLVAILIAVVVFWVNDWRFKDNNVLLYAIATAVAILPEGLPAVTTITMTHGVRQMAKQNAIVRTLASLEALGQVTNICSDKTGTLTVGRMSAVCAYLNGERFAVSELAMLVASLCATCSLHVDEPTQSYVGSGDMTEVALAVMAARLNFAKARLLEQYTFVAEFPFDASLKRMTVVYRSPSGSVLLLAKGALESLQPLCTDEASGNTVRPIAGDSWGRVHAEANRMAGEGLRVLTLAWREIPAQEVTMQLMDQLQALERRMVVEQQFMFAGLVGLMDPPRPETAGAIKACHQAGITVHMITGDHPTTAAAIARLIGITPTPASRAQVMVSTDFDQMTEAELDELPELPLVLARCSPATKVKMVDALHRRGKFVAMTGDGVNDASAIKRANVGIAMGLGGSDVTKQASDITLTDDNFATIVTAVAQGRRIFQNIRKFTLHLLSGNIGEVVALIVGLVFNNLSGEPMSPIQILWLNMVTSSPIAVALGVQHASASLMKMPPQRSRRQGSSVSSGLFTWELVADAVVYGVLMGGLALTAFAATAFAPWPIASGHLHGRHGASCNRIYSDACEHVFRARAVGFTTLCMLLLVHGYVCLSQRSSIFMTIASGGQGQWYHNSLFWSVVVGVVVVVPLPYIPFINIHVFSHSGFGLEWGYVAACVVVFVALTELYKLAKRIWLGPDVVDANALP
ncbi:hypothetical protein RI367_005359 [Sorochytrium milnesiophthora]